jgi:hypothetical protein
MTKSASSAQPEKEQIKATTRFLKRYQPLINPFLLPISRQVMPLSRFKHKQGGFTYFKKPPPATSLLTTAKRADPADLVDIDEEEEEKEHAT